MFHQSPGLFVMFLKPFVNGSPSSGGECYPSGTGEVAVGAVAMLECNNAIILIILA